MGAPTCLSEQARHLIVRQLVNELVKLDAIYGHATSVRRWADSQAITRGPRPLLHPQSKSREVSFTRVDHPRPVGVGCGGRMGSDSVSHGPCLAARGRWSGPLFTVAHTT